jgi:hypothetical protein
MKATSFWIAACALASALIVRADDSSNVTQTIIDNAAAGSCHTYLSFYCTL